MVHIKCLDYGWPQGLEMDKGDVMGKRTRRSESSSASGSISQPSPRSCLRYCSGCCSFFRRFKINYPKDGGRQTFLVLWLYLRNTGSPHYWKRSNHFCCVRSSKPECSTVVAQETTYVKLQMILKRPVARLMSSCHVKWTSSDQNSPGQWGRRNTDSRMDRASLCLILWVLTSIGAGSKSATGESSFLNIPSLKVFHCFSAKAF